MLDRESESQPPALTSFIGLCVCVQGGGVHIYHFFISMCVCGGWTRVCPTGQISQTAMATRHETWIIQRKVWNLQSSKHALRRVLRHAQLFTHISATEKLNKHAAMRTNSLCLLERGRDVIKTHQFCQNNKEGDDEFLCFGIGWAIWLQNKIRLKKKSQIVDAKYFQKLAFISAIPSGKISALKVEINASCKTRL